ncbi:HD domain-containing protein [Clostridium felsineum]|uniref:Uncharacterized protein n=1 Tax=Clostridium felsineum TaxID=36839 RepID=A0A1S8LML4_9CLOT|nr:HD domain-containing protein [Clostridium felsineum]URZ05192.1 hypothetical protein CLROS_005160 [Clostridium felsineum]URZ10233.1 hypothetical protein CROST_009410 [Clostridium felsineum]
MFLEQVMDNHICRPIEKKYNKWYKFMQENINFSLKDSLKHTKDHCTRVLVLALVIAYQIRLSDEELDILSLVAIFHDSRRFDDWIDKGHGKRAAKYYKNYCFENNFNFNKQVYYIMYYHDQEDELGFTEIKKEFIDNEKCILMYKIFKDADGLDRLRLSKDALDINMLRTEEARKAVDFAKYLLEKSM